MRNETRRAGIAPLCRLTLLLAVVALAVWLGPAGSDNPAQANNAASVGIDVSISGNSALALGSTTASTDICKVIAPGATTEVDFYVKGLSDLASWDGYIKIDPADIKFTQPGANIGNTSRFLLQSAQPSPNPGNQVQNTSEALPDPSETEIYRVGANDLNSLPSLPDPGPTLGAHQDGVLLRLEIQGQAAANGWSSLQISPIATDIPGVTVGTALTSTAGTGVGDGADADPFIDAVTNAGIVVSNSGSCAESGDTDGVPDQYDNCPNLNNSDQANFDGDSLGDACDNDDDNDGLADASEPASPACTAPTPGHSGQFDPDCDGDLVSDGSLDSDSLGPIVAGPDNCILVPNPTQVNTDGDAFGDACDVDADNDGVPDATDNCPVNFNPSQSNFDLVYGDTQGGDACDPEDDGDGYNDLDEAGTPLCNGINNDTFDDAVIDDGCPGGPGQSGSFSEAQFKIGTNPLDNCGEPHASGYSQSWPADVVATGGFSANKVNISDIASYIAPIRRFNTSPNSANFSARWDVVPGSSFSSWINIVDLSNFVITYPLMFGGVREFGGPTCTP